MKTVEGTRMYTTCTYKKKKNEIYVRKTSVFQIEKCLVKIDYFVWKNNKKNKLSLNYYLTLITSTY